MPCRICSLSLVPSFAFILFHTRVYFDCIFIVALQHFFGPHLTQTDRFSPSQTLIHLSPTQTDRISPSQILIYLSTTRTDRISPSQILIHLSLTQTDRISPSQILIHLSLTQTDRISPSQILIYLSTTRTDRISPSQILIHLSPLRGLGSIRALFWPPFRGSGWLEHNLIGWTAE